MFGLSFHRCGLRAIQNNHCFILARFVVFFFNVYSRRLQNYYVLFEFWLLSSRPFGKGEYYLKGALNAINRDADFFFLLNKKIPQKQIKQPYIIQTNKKIMWPLQEERFFPLILAVHIHTYGSKTKFGFVRYLHLPFNCVGIRT